MRDREKAQDVEREDGRSFAPWFFGLAAWGLVALWYYRTPAPETIERYYAHGVYRLIVSTSRR